VLKFKKKGTQMKFFKNLFKKKKEEAPPDVPVDEESDLDEEEAALAALEDDIEEPLNEKENLIEAGIGFCQGCRTMGSWKSGYVWNESEIYYLEKDPDLDAFFAQEDLPYLLPDCEKYISAVKDEDDPRTQSIIHWAIAYLHHPNPDVTEKLLQCDIPFDLYPLSEAAVWAMHHPYDHVAQQAVRNIWKYGYDLDKVFNRLSDRAGIDRIRAGVVCRFLQESCPEEKKAELDGKIEELMKIWE
jgi:hypothetical protein